MENLSRRRRFLHEQAWVTGRGAPLRFAMSTLCLIVVACEPSEPAQPESTPRIHGTTVDWRSDEPVAASLVRLFEVDGTTPLYSQRTGPSGEFEFTTLPEGEYRLVAMHSDYRSHELEPVILAGEEHEINIALLPDTTNREADYVFRRGSRTMAGVGAGGCIDSGPGQRCFVEGEVRADTCSDGVSFVEDVVLGTPALLAFDLTESGEIHSVKLIGKMVSPIYWPSIGRDRVGECEFDDADVGLVAHERFASGDVELAQRIVVTASQATPQCDFEEIWCELSTRVSFEVSLFESESGSEDVPW